MRIEFAAPTGRAKTAQCNALGSRRSISQALKGRNTLMIYFAPSGLGDCNALFPSALRWASIFGPVGAGKHSVHRSSASRWAFTFRSVGAGRI